MSKIFPLLFFILSAPVSFAQQVTVINRDNESVIIQSDIAEYTEATAQPESIQNILSQSAQKKFRTNNRATGSYFMSRTGHWYRFNLQSKTKKPLLLEVHKITIDEISCYVVDTRKEVIALPPVNWSTPLEQRTINTFRNVFRLPVDSGETAQVFIRLKKNTGTLRTYFTVWQEGAFTQDTEKEFSIIGFLSGVFLFIFVLSLLLFLSSADVKYLYYSGYVLSVTLWRFTIEGYLLSFLSKHFPAYADPSFGNLWLITSGAFSALFLKAFVLNKNKSPRWHYHLANFNIILITSFIVLFLFFRLSMFSFQPVGWLYYLCINLCIFNGFLFSISGMRRGETNSYIYFFSNFAFLIYSATLVSTNVGLIPNFLVFRISIMWALFIEITVLCIGLGIDFRRQLLQRKNLLLEVSEQQRLALEANNKLQQQAIKTIQAENILRNEKERISSDLHDSIGSDLSNIIYNLDFISSKLKGSEHLKDIEQLQQFSRNTMEQLRSAIWVLKQEQVSIEDFCHKLRSYISKHLNNYQNLSYAVDATTDIRNYVLPTTHALYLYRIIQEALNNTMKYANASLFSINLEKQNGKLLITITDNGVGFASTNVPPKESYGLDNMAKRVESLEGEFSISSASGKGTAIKILIPIIV